MPSSLRRLAAMTLLLVCAIADADEPIGAFSEATAGGALPSGWRLAKLPGVKPTRFDLVDADGVVALRMDAADAGAALFRPVRIDPARTPILRWRWWPRRGLSFGPRSGDETIAGAERSAK